jgi:Zn finger protein HypA/HybF involved in hydrogenase expression
MFNEILKTETRQEITIQELLQVLRMQLRMYGNTLLKDERKYFNPIKMKTSIEDEEIKSIQISMAEHIVLYCPHHENDLQQDKTKMICSKCQEKLLVS